ncbi:uncharacterized protein TRIADDRAFT_27469, partial [Trichoplax adhaerens]
RYLLTEIIYEDEKLADSMLTGAILYRAIKEAIGMLYGDYGLSCITSSLTGMEIKYLNVQTKIAFIRCNRNYFRMVWCAITFIKSLNNCSCFFRTLHLGGTIRSCQKFLIKYNKMEVSLLLSQFKNDDKQ